MTRYRALEEIPPLVRRAMEQAQGSGFENSCWPEVGRLLRVLAAQVRTGRIAEIGTGCGVGTAWLSDALSPEVRLVTIELDEARARLAQQLFAHLPNVLVLQDDWHGILSRGPFNLLFADGGSAKRTEPDALVQAMKVGGMVVLDDLWPEGTRPPEEGDEDPVRSLWLNDNRMAVTDVQVSPKMSVILATRLR